MKYYSEEESGKLRLSLEDEVLKWRYVTAKKMFGCPCYKVKDRLFVFLVTNGIVLTHLGEVEKEKLSHEYQAGYFSTGRKEIKNWPQVRILNVDDLKALMPYIKKSYQNALESL